MYASIRKRTTDVMRIAKNTSFTEVAVNKIKNHMFFAEHKFRDGIIKRFDPDFEQAQAWDRLTQGTHTEVDILLLKHEYLELTLMKQYGYVYEDAHEIVDKTHNWAAVIARRRKHEK